MPDYDFHTLSPIDFELLSRDLLQKELNLTFESFTPGKDQGIDFRAFTVNTEKGRHIILQSKHYKNFSDLKKEIKNTELDKIKKLSPDRYILSISLSLTPKQKDEIFGLLDKYVKKIDDIITGADLNNFLNKYPEIEENHFKLWLPSTTVLNKIINNSIHTATKLEHEEIIKKSKVYVINNSYKEALRILDEQHYCIISGIPGIGKTTLAQMLVLKHLKDKYKFITVHNIDDVYQMEFLADEHIIYLYDDFLGQTTLDIEKMGHKMLGFLQYIACSKNKRFLLTTREYILQQAQTINENFTSDTFDVKKHILNLAYYTRPIRANILYNHLYFSGLNQKYIAELVNRKIYMEIIAHKNFSPRIIEFMTQIIPNKNGVKTSSDYIKLFLKTLNNPEKIWEHAFLYKISETSRDLLIILAGMRSNCSLDKLFAALESFMHKDNKQLDRFMFDKSLKELNGTFIEIEHFIEKDNILISFHNPSIHDYINSYIQNKPQIVIKMISKAKYFEQIKYILNHSIAHNTLAKSKICNHREQITNACNRILKPILLKVESYGVSKDHACVVTNNMAGVVNIYAFLCSKAKLPGHEYLQDFIESEIENIILLISHRHGICFENDDLIAFLKNLIPLNVCTKEQKKLILEVLKQELFDNTYFAGDIQCLFEFFDLFYPPEFTDILALEKCISELEIKIDDEDLLEDDIYTLENIKRQHSICHDALDDKIDEITIYLDSLEEKSVYPNRKGKKILYKNSNTQETISDNELQSMFESLITS